MAGRRCGRANTGGRRPEYGCDLRCDRLYRAAGGRTSCVDGAGGRGLCRTAHVRPGGERPRGTIIELCGNAGRSRGLAHAWRHRIALERPTLRARHYTSIGLPTSVDTCDGERCGGSGRARTNLPRATRARDRSFSRRTISTCGTIPPVCPEYALDWAAGSEPRRRYWQVQGRWKRRGGETA
jgi:hypothetical protein